MNVLVTGGSGFIGTAVVARLLADGHRVAVADLRPTGLPVDRLVVGDLRDDAVLADALDTGTEAVVHLAAATSVVRSLAAPDEVFRSNVALTQALLERCRTLGVGRFVAASTNAVVGSGAEGGVIDERSPLRPLSPYGATKAAAEMLCSAYAASYGLAATSLRLTNVYGPGVWVKDSMVPRLMRAARAGAGIRIFGDGLQVRDYVYLDDVVEAFCAALTRPLPPAVVIGSGRSVSVVELHALVCAVTGVDIAAEHVAGPPGEMRAVVVDRSVAAGLGLGGPVGLEDGLRLTWEAWPADAATPTR